MLDGLLSSLELQRDSVAVGWGYRPSGRAAIADSLNRDRGLLLLEDGFVRSLKPGAGISYSLVADSTGIYYDASGRSDLISALNRGEPCGSMIRECTEDVPALICRFRELGISKYNWYPGAAGQTPLPVEKGVLVVDQTRGDTSLEYGGVRQEDFERMVRDALDEHPSVPIYIRSHPDHRYRGKHSCFPAWVFDDQRVVILPPDLSPAQCFSFVSEVYVGTSLMGMEGLIHGLKVKTYGWNFYAGWGLTEDRGGGGVAPRERTLDLATLFRMAYLQYSRYFDPDFGEPCGLGTIMDHLALQHEMHRRNRGHFATVGFSPWKRDIVPGYVESPVGKISHFKALDEARDILSGKDSRLLVWGRRPEIPEIYKDRAIRVEDGFIRSRGLGAVFNFPYSWVFDSCGIYFDPGAPSDLENLYNAAFTPAELQEAGELIRVLRENRLTKYNLAGRVEPLSDSLVLGRKVILVPGQVEADASIEFGSPQVRSNIDLLRKVRENEPHAFLVFKAHPDLVAGARHGQVTDLRLKELADFTVTEGNVLDWLDVCDEVHTMTSTVGFEALIRQVPVVTYGLPFYAGWGLTRDHLTCERRKRNLTLEELVCGALMKYPRYLNPGSGEFTTALKVSRLLASPDAAGDRRQWHLRMVSRLKKMWVGIARKTNLT